MRRSVLALAMAASLGARADGAFPTGMSVLLPAALPQRILVGTTFGLVISEDAGVSWRYVCEPHVTGSLANVLAQILGPATCPAVESACADDFAQLQRTLSVPVANCSCGQRSGGVTELLIFFALLARRRRARA